MIRNFLWVFLTSSATVACQLLAKKGLAGLAVFDPGGRPLQTLFAVATSPWILGGLAIQAFGFATWLTVIARTHLTWAVGIASVFVYLLTALLNWALFAEGLNRVQIAGILLLCFGAALLSYAPSPQ